MKLLTLILFISTSWSAQPPFRFHLMSEPHTITPAELSTSESSYFFSTIYRGLYKYSDQKGLVPDGAQKCEFKGKLKVVCTLNPNAKWHDGSPVLASHYVQAFRDIFNPQYKSRVSQHLLSLKNAKKILAGKAPANSLGIQGQNLKLTFTFDQYDGEFIYKLSSPFLTPWKVRPNLKDPNTYINNGPYHIQKWNRGKKIHLVANPHYPHGNPKRPPVEVYFVEEDSTALNLYLVDKLDFLRRLPTSQLVVYKDRKDYLQKPFSRFDYVGFNLNQLKNKNLRKALALSVDFKEFQKIFHSLGRPGCSGLSPDLMNNKTPCLSFNPQEAKKALALVPKEQTKNLKFRFSRVGGDDLKKAAEWYQNQWQKHLGLKVELELIERGMMHQTLRYNTPSLFRKGVTLDRPTCLSALEIFHSKSEDNYIQLKSKTYDKILNQLATSQNPRHKKNLCTQGIQYLIDNYAIIPQGRYFYSLMNNGRFEGWRINEMNQMDLSELKVSQTETIKK